MTLAGGAVALFGGRQIMTTLKYPNTGDQFKPYSRRFHVPYKSLTVIESNHENVQKSASETYGALPFDNTSQGGKKPSASYSNFFPTFFTSFIVITVEITQLKPHPVVSRPGIGVQISQHGQTN